MAAAPLFPLPALATAVAAVGVLLGAGITVRQRHRADRKEQWWVRTHWALELLVSSDDGRQVLGCR